MKRDLEFREEMHRVYGTDETPLNAADARALGMGPPINPGGALYHGPVKPKPLAKEVMRDNVNRPDHYARWPVEPIYFLGMNRVDFLRANVIKYVMRADAKNGREDVRKAHRYLDMWERFHYGRGDTYSDDCQDPKWADMPEEKR